jgi:PilZ domain
VEQDDRRRELRVRSRGQVLLVTEDQRSIPATICDVSNLGMRVETSEELASGLALRIEVHGFDALGVVRHCVRKDDKYQIGVHLYSDKSHPDASGSEHLP